MLLATQTQAVSCPGTHTFAADLAELKKLRSSIMRSMWKTDCYSMSSYVIFALLLPSQLDPLFGHIYQGLRTIARCVRDPYFAATTRRRLTYYTGSERDGPTVRLWHLPRDQVYAPFVATLVGAALFDEERWTHDMRMRRAWRKHLWELVAKHKTTVMPLTLTMTAPCVSTTSCGHKRRSLKLMVLKPWSMKDPLALQGRSSLFCVACLLEVCLQMSAWPDTDEKPESVCALVASNRLSSMFHGIVRFIKMTEKSFCK